MGVMTNVGGGGGGNIRYNPATDMIQVKYNGAWVDTPYRAYAQFDGIIYEDGVAPLGFDNPASYVKGEAFPNMSVTSSWDLSGGLQFNATTIEPVYTIGSTRYGCGTSVPVDLTPYDYLKVLSNIDGTDTVTTKNISDVSGEYYITLASAFGHIGGGINNYMMVVDYNQTKTLVSSKATYITGPTQTYKEVRVSKIWLE